MSNLSPELCEEAARVAASPGLKITNILRLLFSVSGALLMGSSWIPHPNAKVLYLTHIYLAFHVCASFAVLYAFQLIRTSIISGDPCFYVYNARVAILIRFLPGIAIPLQSFNMFTFAVERVFSTLYPAQYEKVTRPYLGIIFIFLSIAAAVSLNMFCILLPTTEDVYVTGLTSRNPMNYHTFQYLNYIPFGVEVATITLFIFTYYLNEKKGRELATEHKHLGNKYQIAENQKVFRTLFPCFLTHFCLNGFSYFILALYPLFFPVFDIISSTVYQECLSQSQTYSIVLPLIIFWRTKRKNRVHIYTAETAATLYFDKLDNLKHAIFRISPFYRNLSIREMFYVISFYLLLIILGFVLFSVTFYMFLCLDDLQDCMDKPRSVCDTMNRWTPLVAGIQWCISMGLFFYGSYYLFFYNLPMSLLFIHQYSQRVADSGYGYHNPLKFFSKRHLQGLVHVFLVMSIYYIVSVFIYTFALIIRLVSS